MTARAPLPETTSSTVSILEADYVVVGAGAVGLAFVDVLLDQTDADILLIDRRAEPSGHWRDAYPFVRLHNVSALYGVNSRPLGSGALDTAGLDAGCMERAGLTEILDYYDTVFRETLLASGRVRWLPEHDYRPEGVAVSLVDGKALSIRARRRVVDATFTDARLPKTHGPGFPVAPGVRCISPDALEVRADGASGYTVIGAGKTAMDVALHLLSQGVDPDDIAWVRPREPWLLNRRRLQPAEPFFEDTVGGLADEMEAASQAGSVDEFFLKLEAAGVVLRLDRAVVPTMFRCAIAGEREVEALRSVRDVVRLGHVMALEPDRMVLEHGVRMFERDRVHVHCTADGVPRKTPVPIFQKDRIVPQYVRRCAPVFAAAMIARIEALNLTDAEKNDLCQTVPMVDEPAHWVQAHLIEGRNRLRWNGVPELRTWLATSRLDGFGKMITRVAANPTPAQAAVLDRYRRALQPGYARMSEWVSSGRPQVGATTASLPGG